MLIDKTFHIKTCISETFVLDTGTVAGDQSGQISAIINELDINSSSQKWNLIPLCLNGALAYLLVNEAGQKLSRSTDGKILASIYNPFSPITDNDCWLLNIMDEDGLSTAVFNSINTAGVVSQLVMDVFESIVQPKTRVCYYNWHKETNQEWKFLS